METTKIVNLQLEALVEVGRGRGRFVISDKLSFLGMWSCLWYNKT